MQKITEIYIEKEYLKSERDAYGNRVKVPTIGRFKREPELVGHWARLGHYLIDFIIITALAFLLAILVALAFPKLFTSLTTPLFYFKLGYFEIRYDVFSMLLIVAYYLVTEATMQRSIGKFVTGTVVIDEYANKPPTSVLVGRSFARLIPFDAFSCLGARGWHDKVSATYVVKKAKQKS